MEIERHGLLLIGGERENEKVFLLMLNIYIFIYRKRIT